MFRDHLQHTFVDVTDINSSVLKGDAKYSDVCLTRQTPSTSGVFWSVVLSTLMMVVAIT
jgi:hypothetical protein